MHDHQRVSRSPVTELLQEFIEDVVVVPNTRVSFRNQILEQPRSLKEMNALTLVPKYQLNLRNFLFCEYSRMKYEHSRV